MKFKFVALILILISCFCVVGLVVSSCSSEAENSSVLVRFSEEGVHQIHANKKNVFKNLFLGRGDSISSFGLGENGDATVFKYLASYAVRTHSHVVFHKGSLTGCEGESVRLYGPFNGNPVESFFLKFLAEEDKYSQSSGVLVYRATLDWHTSSIEVSSTGEVGSMDDIADQIAGGWGKIEGFTTKVKALEISF